MEETTTAAWHPGSTTSSPSAQALPGRIGLSKPNSSLGRRNGQGSSNAMNWRVAGAGRLHGGGAEVRRPRPLDRLGLPRPARPPAPLASNSRFLVLPGPRTPNLASRVLALCARRAAADLAGALRPSAAAGDLRRSGALPRHRLPRRDRTCVGRTRGFRPSAAATARRTALPSWSSFAPGRRRAGAPDAPRAPARRPTRRSQRHALRRHHAFPSRVLPRRRRPAPAAGPPPPAARRA